MRTYLVMMLFASVISSTWQFRSKSSSSSSNIGSSKKSDKEEFNIGLIAPHTNFGKREYLRAINSAMSALNKLSSTKLGFLKEYSFTATNVHFDMMSLTPSPTSMRSHLILNSGTLFNYSFFLYCSHPGHNVQGVSARQCIGYCLYNEL